MAKIINDAQPMREVEQDIVAYINGDDGLGKQLADIQSDVDANKQGVAENKQGVAENKQAIADLSDSVGTSEQTLGAAIQKNATDISAANTAIEKNAADIASANTVIQKNATDIESANTAIEKNAADITSANTAIKKNAADIASANDAIRENGGKIDVINQTIDQMSQETEASLEGKQAKLTASAPITLDDSGKIGVSKASAEALGVVKIGNGISISNEGAISSEVPNPAVNTVDTNNNITAWTENDNRGTGNIGVGSHTEGTNCAASNAFAHAEGDSTNASGRNSHAEGYTTSASADSAHAEGMNSKSQGVASHAEGNITTSSGNASHSEGYSTQAIGAMSHAEGNHSISRGDSSHAEGNRTVAIGSSSHAAGYGVTASSLCQTVIGEYNVIDSDGSVNEKSAHSLIIGNGNSDNNRSNAHTVTWDGTAWYAGDVTCDAVQGNHDNLYSMRAMGAVVASTPSMEYGTSNSVSVVANAHTLVDITFGTAKTEAPIVFTSVQHATAGVNLICTVQSVTNQQASLCVTNLGTTDVDNITIDWLALSGR